MVLFFGNFDDLELSFLKPAIDVVVEVTWIHDDFSNIDNANNHIDVEFSPCFEIVDDRRRMRDWHLLYLAALEHGKDLLQTVVIGSARFEPHNYVLGDRHKDSHLADPVAVDGVQNRTTDAGKKLSKIDFYPTHKRGLPLP